MADVPARAAGGFSVGSPVLYPARLRPWSFFASRLANDLLGWAIGLVTLTPHTFWRNGHAIHQANSGNLDNRGIGNITMLTVREYLALSPLRRFLYRAYRHPLVLFGLGPVCLFVVKNRIPIAYPFRHRKIWSSILGTNSALAAVVMMMVLTVGGHAFMLAYIPVILLAASIGIYGCSISSNTPTGRTAGIGISIRRRWRAALSTICPECCTG